MEKFLDLILMINETFSAASVAHVAGEFYPLIVDTQGQFSIQIVLSGYATGIEMLEKKNLVNIFA